MKEPSPERSGVLLLRVWTETGAEDELRVRVIACEPPAAPELLAPRVGVRGVLGVVESWLQSFTRAG
jgi:hypothetical protein